MLYLNKPIPPRKVLGADIETNGLDPFGNRLLSLALSDGQDVWLYLNGLHDFSPALAVLEDPSVLKVLQNAKFDLKWIKQHFGITVSNVFDTYLAEAVLCSGAVEKEDEDEEGEVKTHRIPLGLADILARYGWMISKEERKTFIDHPGFDVVPITNEQIHYIMQDVLYLSGLYRAQLERVAAEGASKALKLELAVLPATVDLELDGVAFDEELWGQQKQTFVDKIREHDDRLRFLLSEKTVYIEVEASVKKQPVIKQITCDEVNFNSPKQLVQALKAMGTPVENTRKATLADLNEDDTLPAEAAEFVHALLELRKWKKRLGFDYPKFINPVTGKIHPDFHQLGAATGRFSCSNPNLQQVPRPVPSEPNMRHLFLADNPDCVLIRADYSQQEPRIMAQLSGDPEMIKACNSEDVYIEFAKLMYGREVDKKSPERFQAKTFVLAVGYGAGEDRLHKSTRVPLEEVRLTRNTIKQSFPQMASFGSRMEKQAQIYGYVQTALGRRNYIQPGPRMFSQAVNSPVQGTGADMLKMALARFYVYLTEQKNRGKLDPSTRVWLLVHDEIVVQAHKDQAEEVAAELKRVMEEVGAELCPDVRHIAEAGIDYRWNK